MIAVGFKMLIDWLASFNSYFASWTIVGTIVCTIMGVYATARVIIAIVAAILNARNTKNK